MKIIKILLTLIVLSGLVLIFELSINSKSDINSIAVHNVVENMEIPDFTLYDNNGQPIKLSELRGNGLFLNFWATWCQSCAEEMPSIEELFKIKSEAKDFKLITIIYNDNPEAVKAYMQKNSFTFPVLWDKDGAAAKIFGLTGVPETYLIDKSGILRRKIIGPNNWADPQSIKAMDQLIGT